MRTLLTTLPLVALLFTGCGDSYDAQAPDGGRGRVNCSEREVQVPVTVLRADGAAAEGAVVQATYRSVGEVATFAVDDDGVALVTDKGPGVVEVKAQLQGATSGPAELTFIGGECSASVTPRSVTLQLP